MKDAKWDDEEAAKIYQEGLSERFSDDESMITVDESGFVNFQTKLQIDPSLATLFSNMCICKGLEHHSHNI